MSSEKEWFGGDSTEERLERCYWRRVGFVVFAALALAMLLGSLAGCASQTSVKVCEMSYLGKSERNNPIFLTGCESVEQFKADQK